MSAFGAYDVDLAACQIDFLVSSANKNIEGVPGFAFALCKKEKLVQGVHARSLSLDLLEQWKGLEGNGQFRFTPPTHALLAFRQALDEHEAEGGVAGRGARYVANFEVLKAGMKQMGFNLLCPEAVQVRVGGGDSAVAPSIPPPPPPPPPLPHYPPLLAGLQGNIISTFLFPDDPNFDFQRFYAELAARGHVIYPGKLTSADCFRLGNIGRVFQSDMHNLVSAIRDVLTEMDVTLPVTQISAPGSASK